MKVYLVGGAVRDKLLGIPVKEKDWVVVGSTPQEMRDKGYKQVGKDFPVFINPKTGEEYALARTERKSGHGYTGFEFDTNPNVTLEEDLARRDLTINAIAQDEDGTLIDPFNGQEDIKNKKLRHVSDAFSEDPLRVLRVARFKANLKNFEITKETLQKIEKVIISNEMKYLTGERIWLELIKSHDPLRFFFALKDISPETLLDIFPHATIKSDKQPSIDPYTGDITHDEIKYMTKEEEDRVFDRRMVDHPDYLDWPKYVQISYLLWLFVPPDSNAVDVALENISAPNECKELSKLLYFNVLVGFELNESFEETIKSRFRDVFKYDNFSQGEKMRIDLALLFTWRAVARLKNSVNTNILILDEVFDSSLDSQGTDDFLKLLNALNEKTNAFIISHKGDQLYDKFEEVIRFEKSLELETSHLTRISGLPIGKIFVHKITLVFVGSPLATPYLKEITDSLFEEGKIRMGKKSKNKAKLLRNFLLCLFTRLI